VIHTSLNRPNCDQTERNARQYEELLALQRRIQAQMAMIDPETRREVDEVQRLEQDISNFTSSVLSEPTTPTNHTNGHTANNRFSSVLASPSMFPSDTSRADSQMTSPPSEFKRPITSHTISQLPSQSVPGSKRNSEHEVSDEDYGYGFPETRQKAGAKYVFFSSLSSHGFDFRPPPL